jgi:phenylpyruvate tautomerase PptA (4-oxalocrotonate tautomerase family)
LVKRITVARIEAYCQTIIDSFLRRAKWRVRLRAELGSFVHFFLVNASRAAKGEVRRIGRLSRALKQIGVYNRNVTLVIIDDIQPSNVGVPGFTRKRLARDQTDAIEAVKEARQSLEDSAE